MSQIDTFDHEFVGYFVGLPVYHPTEVEEGGDFDCGPDTLVVGGGMGEHPALVVSHLEFLVAQFLLAALPDEDETPDAPSPYPGAWDQALIEALGRIDDIDEVLTFHGWRLDHSAAFYEGCKSPANQWPFDEEAEEQSHLNVMDWICISLGEFVFYAMPSFAAGLLDQLPGVRQVIADTKTAFQNVLVVPPGYPVHFGRSTHEGRTTYGCSFWKNSASGAEPSALD